MTPNTVKEIRTFSLKNKSGMEASILTAGASIGRIAVPDRNRKTENVTLGFQDQSLYFQNPLYAGAVLGPVSGRIKNGLLPIGGKTYQLTQNDGQNHLHGGNHSLSFLNWEPVSFTEDLEQEIYNVTLSAQLADGVDGFPGSRSFTASYTLKGDNTLTLRYTARSDKDTYFNLSNHSYFNLSGDFSQSGLDQELTIHAKRYIANNKEHLPEALCPVSDTPFDFTSMRSLKNNMEQFSNDPQLLQALGYNNGFDLRSGKGAAEKASSNDSLFPCAVLFHKNSGRQMELSTNAPCLVLYSGGYIPEDLVLTEGILSSPACGIALEAQDFPDAPGCGLFPYHCTKAGETYERIIQYRFSTK